MNIISIPYTHNITEPFETFSEDPCAILLQSAGQHKAAQFSFFTSTPSHTIDSHIQGINSQAGQEQLRELKQQLNHALSKNNNTSSLPFSCGWIGYAHYEFGQARIVHNENPANFWAGFYEWAAIFDHTQHTAQLIYLDTIDKSLLKTITQKLAQPTTKTSETFTCSSFTQLTSKVKYETDFSRIQHYLDSGDCYQINYAQPYQANFTGDTFEAYKQLSRAVPSPFMAFINQKEHSILSISPERLLQVKQSSMRSSPIKGTEKRSSNLTEDQYLASNLKASDKNRAENLMIVDLIRNDLSKHAQLGSVKVPELFTIESFSNVHHLVSHIDAKLNNDSDAFDVFFDAFPGGSITGAPKIRAMEIINELEQQERGIYCGSIFYASCNQQFDSNIAIRTLYCNKMSHTITAWAGGGIVKDSNVEDEYQECKNKIDKLLRAITSEQ